MMDDAVDDDHQDCRRTPLSHAATWLSVGVPQLRRDISQTKIIKNFSFCFQINLFPCGNLNETCSEFVTLSTVHLLSAVVGYEFEINYLAHSFSAYLLQIAISICC